MWSSMTASPAYLGGFSNGPPSRIALWLTRPYNALTSRQRECEEGTPAVDMLAC